MMNVATVICDVVPITMSFQASLYLKWESEDTA